MPLPLVPVFAVAGAAAVLSMNEHGQAPGAVSAPDEHAPDVDERPPPAPPMPISTTSAPTGPGNAPPPDPAMSVVEGAVGDVVGEAKVAVVGAASVGIGVIEGGGTIAEGFSAAAGSAGSSASSAASGAAGVVGPAAVVAADVLMVAGAFYDMFGGDLSNLVPTNAAGLSDAQMAEWDAAGRTPMALARIEGRTGQKLVTTATGDEVLLGQNALTHETAAQAKARIAAQLAEQENPIDPISGRPRGLTDRFLLG